MKPVTIIPARMASTRLPGKPLAEISGVPMIVQVWRRAKEAGLGPVLVAAGEPEIVEAVERAGGNAVLTDPEHPSGSDRIFEALSRFDPGGAYDVVVNLQGDLPTIDPEVIKAAVAPLDDPKCDIATLVAEIIDDEERTNPNVCKAVLSLKPGDAQGRALYFTRASAPTGNGPMYHHIGIYAYRRAALERFVGLAPSPLEKQEKLEQLRALENDMVIRAAIVDKVPAGVDTPEDLELARREIAAFE